MSSKDLAYAFPYPEEEQSTFSSRGMTLRDYFAAAALQGMLCNGFMPDQARQSSDEMYNYTLAAYALSNAMLEARKQ